MTGLDQPVPAEPAPVGEALDLRARPIRDDAVVIEVRGAVDLSNADTVERTAAEQVAQGRTDIVLDLAGVPLCDSTGLTALIRIHRLAAARGGRLRLVAPQPPVRALLEMTNLTRIFSVHETVADALAAR
jgi:anti-sigma B factor antagonist